MPTPNLRPDSQRDPRRFALPLILLAICAGLYFWRLGVIPLEDFDEAYYAEGAREMLSRGDLATPYFNGQPFLLKPILIYWIIAAAFRLLGPTEFAARLPSAFLGTGVVMLTYWFASRTLSRRAGFLAGLALALSYMWIDIARDASIDIPLTAALTPALFLFFLGAQAPPQTKSRLYLPAYALCGLALLAKGPVPVAVVLTGFFAYLLAARRLRTTLAQARLLPGIALVLAVAAPWYLYELRHEPAFFATFFLGEHFGHIHGELARTEPVWGNLRYLLIYFLPWAAFLPAALLHALRRPDPTDVRRFAAWWAIAVVVLFSIPQSKLAHYLAPAFPPMALLVGAWLDDWLEGRHRSRIGVAAAFAVIGLVGAACAVVAGIAITRPPWLRESLAAGFGSWTPGNAPAVILVALAAGFLAAALLARWRPATAVLCLASAMLVAGIAHVGWLSPRRALIQAQPRKELALLLSASLPPSEPVGVYYAKRNATIFYLGRPIVDLGERDDEFPALLRFLSSPTPATVLTHRKLLPRLEASLPMLSAWENRGDYVVISNHPQPTAR